MENKENGIETKHFEILQKIMTDLTRWVDKRKSDCLDDSHWPVSNSYMWSLRGVYDAFPAWKDDQFWRVANWHDRMLDVKEQIELEMHPHGQGLSAQDLLQQHINTMISEPTEVEIHVDGNLIPPPLQSGTDIQYTLIP